MSEDGDSESLRQERERFLTAVEAGIAAADRGDFIEEDEMDSRLEAMFQSISPARCALEYLVEYWKVLRVAAEVRSEIPALRIH